MLPVMPPLPSSRGCGISMASRGSTEAGIGDQRAWTGSRARRALRLYSATFFFR